jgi:hypothetical protein
VEAEEKLAAPDRLTLAAIGSQDADVERVVPRCA